MKRAAPLLLFLLSSGCLNKDKFAPPPDASIPADAGVVSAGLSDDDARAIAKGACFSCHAEEMLAQQRLTAAQWTKVVTKMVGWGANLDTKDTEPLTAWLAATYGPDAGPYEAKRLAAEEALGEIAATPDGPFANGDAERGRAVYAERCASCHGPEGRGGIGVLVVDRPFLYRAADVAETIRRGRGKMAPIALADAEIGDVLAHLRRLKNP